MTRVIPETPCVIVSRFKNNNTSVTTRVYGPMPEAEAVSHAVRLRAVYRDDVKAGRLTFEVSRLLEPKKAMPR